MTTHAHPPAQPVSTDNVGPPDGTASINVTPIAAIAPDYAALDAAHRALSASLHPANKADLFAALARAGIARVTVEFDGYGDSGQIESVDAVGADGAPRDLPATEFVIRRAVWGETEPQAEEMTVAEAIERLAYDLLGGAHPGWEINDGAYGAFVFDVAAGAITLDCNLRFTASELHTSTFGRRDVMAHPYHHALSSQRTWGGTVEDYTAIHDWFDASKLILADFRHRALRHHAEGIFMAETMFGATRTLSTGRVIPTRWVGEQHVREDLGRIPSFADWARAVRPEPWMGRALRLEDGLDLAATDG